MGVNSKTAKSSKVYTRVVADGRFVSAMKKPFSTGKRRLIVMLFVLTIAIAVVGAYLGIRQYNQQQQQARDKQAYTDIVAQYREFTNNNQLQLAESVLSKYVATNPPKQYRSQVELYLGSIEINLRQPQKALTWYQKALADSAKASGNEYYSIGEAYRMLGNQSAAIDNYKKAIEVLKQDGSIGAKLRAEAIQGRIDQMEAH